MNPPTTRRTVPYLRLLTLALVLLSSSRALAQDVRITEFSQTGAKWTLVGEAPSANLAIEYAEKLKAEKELEEWKVISGPPAILKGEQAKFSIEGQP